MLCIGQTRVPTAQSVACAAGAVCHLGSSAFYTCECPVGQEGYQGRFCQDIDECAEGIHSCHAMAKCNNTEVMIKYTLGAYTGVPPRG